MTEPDEAAAANTAAAGPAAAASIAFDAAADYYDRTRGFPADVSEHIGDAMTNAIPAAHTAHVLEVGVGTGRIALPLVRRGLHITGIDLSPPMMRKLRQKIAGGGGRSEETARLKLVGADATRLPFSDASFDAAVEVHVLHLVPEWRRALAEIKRVLRPGGVLLHGHTAGQHGAAHAWSPWIEVRTRWREILGEIGHPVEWVGTKSDEELIAAVRSTAREIEELPPIEWASTDSYRRAFDYLANRCFSDTWRVPDEVFAHAMERLRWSLARDYHGRLDEQHRIAHSFHLFAVHF